MAIVSNTQRIELKVIFNDKEARAFRDLIGHSNRAIREGFITEEQEALLLSIYHEVTVLLGGSND